MSAGQKRSIIWNYFNNYGNRRAECKICKRKISYRSGSTHNLHRHIKTVHPTIQLLTLRQARGSAATEQVQEAGASTCPAVECKTEVPAEWETEVPTEWETDVTTKWETEVSTDTFQAAGSPLTTTVCADVFQPSASPLTTALQSSINHIVANIVTSAKQNTIDQELGKMIASDLHPFSIVEDKGFRKYSHALNPMYVIPSKTELSETIIPGLYDELRASLQERVEKASVVCLTTDCWTSRATVSFMSITCHFIENYKMASCLLDCFEVSDRHTSKGLADELLRVTREWKIDDRVVCCVSDNVANITKAIQLLKWTHQPCLAHTINLIVKDALKVLKPVLDKVKALVDFFHRSIVAAEQLKSIQSQMGLPNTTPKQDCAARWNSTYYMLKCLLDSKDAIIATLAVVYAPVDMLTTEEWEMLREAAAVLEPFEQVTVEISSKSYVTASKMLILCEGLQRITVCRQREAAARTSQGKQLVDALCASMEAKFHGMEYNPVLSESTVLDPRFKELAFSDDRAVDEALQRITIAAGRRSPTMRPARIPDQGQVQEPQTSAVWKMFDERAAGDAVRRNPSTDSILEVRSYLDEPLLRRSADPLNWWESKASIYPRLAEVMKGRLCVLATSVPPERIFSTTGENMMERRSRISPSKVRQLTFLNANLS